MRDFFSILIMPLSILWLLITLAVILFLLKKNSASKWLFFISFLWLLTISTGFIPDKLVKSLENQYSPLRVMPRTPGSGPVFIMVLGAGYSADDSLFPVDRISPNSLCRLAEGIRIQRLASLSSPAARFSVATRMSSPKSCCGVSEH